MNGFSTRIAQVATACALFTVTGTPAAAGESFNLDLQGTYGGLPATFGAASGQQGVWVDLPEAATTPNLVNIDGVATAVSVTVTGVAAVSGAPSTPEGTLLRDGVVSSPRGDAFSVLFTGLPDGDYDVWYYSPNPTFDLTLNDDALENLFGGSEDVFWEQRQNWNVQRTTVTGGTLQIGDRSPDVNDGLAGLQLVYVPPPVGESLNLDFTDVYTGLGDGYAGAAGQAGPWVDVPPNQTLFYPVNVLGQKTSLRVTVTGVGDAYPMPTTEAGELLRDSIQGDTIETAFDVTIEGLLDGVYDVFYYHPDTVYGLSLNGEALQDINGGSADELGPQGSNWNAQRTNVTDGTLHIAEGGFFNQGMSGLQLVYIPPPVVAEALNLDFADVYTGLPNSFGGAAGQPGTWVDVTPNLKHFYPVNTDGNPTTLLLTVNGTVDAFNPQSTEAGLLLRDRIRDDFPETQFVVSLEGLYDGFYDVFYYHYEAVSDFTLNGEPLAALLGGDPDALGAQGSNWNVQRTLVAGGTLEIARGDLYYTGLSGLQIVPVAGPIEGESYNLDFTDIYDGLPGSYGAAAGQTGTWVDVAEGAGTMFNLVNVNGQPTQASLTVTGVGTSDPAPTGDDGVLLRDGFTSQPPDVAFSATLSGLLNGNYGVWYYSPEPTVDLLLNDEPLPDLAGGSGDALGAEGSNWGMVQVEVIDGVLRFGDRSPGADGLSGVQVVYLGPAETVYVDGFEGN